MVILPVKVPSDLVKQGYIEVNTVFKWISWYSNDWSHLYSPTSAVLSMVFRIYMVSMSQNYMQIECRGISNQVS